MHTSRDKKLAAWRAGGPTFRISNSGVGHVSMHATLTMPARPSSCTARNGLVITKRFVSKCKVVHTACANSAHTSSNHLLGETIRSLIETDVVYPVTQRKLGRLATPHQLRAAMSARFLLPRLRQRRG